MELDRKYSKLPMTILISLAATFHGYVELPQDPQALLPNRPPKKEPGPPGSKGAIAEEVVEAIVQVDLRAAGSPWVSG